MNELRILANITPGKIDTNFDEQKSALAQSMELYKNAKFSEEYKTQAKGELATLRKIRKAMDDRRKEVKKEWMGPYEEFESKAKELLQLIDDQGNGRTKKGSTTQRDWRILWRYRI